MKINSLNLKAFFIIMALVSTFALAAEAVNKGNSEAINAEDNCDAKSDEELNLLPSSKEVTKDKVNYVSGGVCIDEVELMKAIANKFPLEIVLVEKTDEYDKENYIADVKVQINDTENNAILDVYTDGPFLLVNLPDGKYKIMAEYNGILQEKQVNIVQKKHTRVVILWGVATESE